MKAARILLAAALALAAGFAAWQTVQPYAGFSEPVVVDVPKGTSTLEMARLLASHGVVKEPWLFLAARLTRPRAPLQAGEYQFSEPASALQVLDRIARGDVHYYELRIPEGANLFEMARAVARLGFIGEDEFLDAARDASMIHDLAPRAQSLEGYLFPSTYRVTRHMQARQICRIMTDEFRKVWSRLGGRQDVHETVTLASLVEKETGLAAERPLVASVYRNRLERGIRLECDPTTIYAALLAGRWRGAIHQSDLARRHPYNTYQRPGLPPGPIASPGEASLEASLRPAPTAYLFFVARPGSGGGHQFSATLAEHKRAVMAYRRDQRNQQTGKARAVPGRIKTSRG